jgi:hypothetical protein
MNSYATALTFHVHDNPFHHGNDIRTSLLNALE